MATTHLRTEEDFPPDRAVAGTINYIGLMNERPRYYANDHSRDLLQLDPRVVRITDARS